MGLSTIIDVALGLTLMYLLLSLVCTTVNEFFATLLSLRAKSLSRACTQLIDNEELRKAFYNNGLIANIKTASAGGAPPLGLPLGAPAADTQATPRGLPRDKDHPSYIDSRTFAMALLSSLGETSQGKSLKPGYKAFPSIDDIKDIVSNLPDGNIRDVLQASLAAGSASVTELRDNIATAFDKAMDRLSGHYKRQMKWLAFGIGAAVAIVFNADSVHLSSVLWSDQALRTQLADSAASVVQKNNISASCNEDDPVQKATCLAKIIKDQQESLRPFPIGWSSEKWRSIVSGDPGSVIWNVICKIAGLILTALAVSLGAPFWFDILQRFVNVRGTGPKPSSEADKALAQR